LLRWLGLSSIASDYGSPRLPTGRRCAERERALEAIGAFLTRNELAVSEQTLTVAQAYLSGSDSHLVRQIDRRISQGGAITSDWLDEAAHRVGRVDELASLSALMQRLESSIDEFSKTSEDARSATSDYNSALVAHVDELQQVDAAGAVISDLASIARAMLKRTRQIERQMVLREAETRKLRRRLDVAKRSAEEDHLTGLPNRRAFEQRFEDEYRTARAAAEPLCVALCDVDHFKRVNDEHGHDAGDRVLRLVADSLARISDERCHVARHGGEEFVLLFRDHSIGQAAASLDALREELSARRFVNRATEQPFGQVTFSAGVADVFAGNDHRAALRAADAALYRAKEGGRNRVECARPEDAGAPA